MPYTTYSGLLKQPDKHKSTSVTRAQGGEAPLIGCEGHYFQVWQTLRSFGPRGRTGMVPESFQRYIKG